MFFQNYINQSPRSEGGTEQEFAQTVLQAQKKQVRHEAAEVADTNSPFSKTELQVFAYQLAKDLAAHCYPSGYGLNEEYEPLESYTTGRSIKQLVIPLPHQIWFPRIVVWCKALDLFNRVQLCKETT